MHDPQFPPGTMVKIKGAGAKYDVDSIMVEAVIWAALQIDNNLYGPSWWYLWNCYHPIPIHEQFVHPIDDDHQASWDDCIWKPSKEKEPA